MKIAEIEIYNTMMGGKWKLNILPVMAVARTDNPTRRYSLTAGWLIVEFVIHVEKP